VLVALLAPDPQARPNAEEARDLLAAVGRGESWEYTPLPVVAVPAAPDGAQPVDEGVTLIGPATELVPPPAAPARGGATSASRVRGSLAVAAVFVVALVAAGVWILGGRDGVVPAEDQVPANGTVDSGTTPSSGAVPVAPVKAGDSAGPEELPTTEAVNPRVATAEPLEPATTSASTPPPTTTTAEEPPPTTETTTTPPPASTEETVTVPNSATAADGARTGGSSRPTT
jgi:eukaryotic-like serine/threonine-protein kinase